MSRFVDVFKLLFSGSNNERHEEEPAECAPHSRRVRNSKKVRGRALQYADSFIFVPSDGTLTGRSRSNTESNLLSGGKFGKSIRSRISQEVEDHNPAISITQEQQSFQEPVYQRLSQPGSNHNGVLHDYNSLSPRGEYSLHCPPGSGNHSQIRPHSFHSLGREYATPTDCLLSSSRYYHSNEDIESLTHDEGSLPHIYIQYSNSQQSIVSI